MKKLFTAIGLSLTLISPVYADKLLSNQPTVKPYSLSAMGCMILLECTEGVEKLSVDSDLLKNPDFDPFREELKAIIAGLDKLGVPL